LLENRLTSFDMRDAKPSSSGALIFYHLAHIAALSATRQLIAVLTALDAETVSTDQNAGSSVSPRNAP
jgi:hypothetical protein